MAAKTLLYTAADETLAPINTYSGENKATKLVVDFSNCGVDAYVKWVRFSNSEPILLGTTISVEYEIPVAFMARGRLEVQPYAIGPDGQVVKFAIRAIPVNRSLEESDENTYDPTDLESIQTAVSDAVIQVGAIWEAYNTGELDGEDGLDGINGIDGVDGAKIISATFVGNDLVFGLDDGSSTTLVNAKLTLKGETGLTGATGAAITSVAFVGNDIVFTKSDATTVTLAGAKLALKGDKGDTGATGATGATPNITVGTVTTGAAGSSVVITKTGTALNPIFNFTIPRGDTGATGATGETGATGADGEDGKNFTILGQYASLSALQAAHPTGVAGDVWAVGTASESDLYIWDTVTNGWKDIGQVGINLDAGSVTLEDLAGNYTATDVEAAFAELITKLGTKAIKPTNEGTATNLHLLKSNGDGTSTFVDTGTVIAATTEKTTPVDADKFLISDSANANNGRRLTWSNIKSTLKTYFETLFPTMTAGNLTYYVATTGSNSNDGLTAGTPFLTIAYALSKIPKNVRHTVTINVAAGTYNETVSINGFYGEGRIQIFGGTDLATSVNFKIKDLVISNNLIYVSIRGFEALTATEVPFQVYSSVRVRLEYLISSAGANTQNGFYIVSSKVFIGSSTISNKISALCASENSDVYTTNFVAGNNNTYGLYAVYGSKIIKYGVQPQGTTAEFATDGGLITSGIVNPAPLASPAFTGTPTAPTASAGTNTTQIATTAFVKALGDTKANSTHTHTTSDVTGLDTALSGKANSTHAHSIGDVTGLESELGGKAVKAVVENKTLLASAWTGASAPFTLDLAVTGVTATSIQDWSTGLAITSAELLALQKANIVDGGQSAGTVTFKAFGVKPTIDIPIIVVKRGD